MRNIVHIYICSYDFFFMQKTNNKYKNDKIGQGHPRVSICKHVTGPRFQMLYSNFQDHRLRGSGELFKGFSIYM